MKSHRILFLSLEILILTGFISCSEFISPNVEEELIEINSPRDSLYTQENAINFWWEENTNIELYHLQIVTPNFDNPSLILDTAFQETFMEVNLDEGKYTWRIRGENASSESPYQNQVFFIDKTPPFAAQSIFPPDSGEIDFSQEIFLQWESKDQPLNQESFSVWDSIFLYELFNNQPILVGEFKTELNAIKKLNIKTLVKNSNRYQWEVKSFDQANNSRLSSRFSFQFQ